MKKIFLVGLFALGLAAPASAADLRVKAPPPPPPVVAVYNWTGFYIGANGGWGQSRSCLDFVTLGGAVVGEGCRERSGGVLGGQLGYRWQTGRFVFGLEAQGDWADLSASRISVINPAFSTTVKTDAIGLFTGQIGYAWDAALFYLKGGAAVTRNEIELFGPLGGVASASATRWGGTLGLGFEYGFAPSWSAGIEYNHLWMGNSSHAFAVVNPLFIAVANSRVRQDVDMVTLRLNYRFGGPLIRY